MLHRSKFHVTLCHGSKTGRKSRVFAESLRCKCRKFELLDVGERRFDPRDRFKQGGTRQSQIEPHVPRSTSAELRPDQKDSDSLPPYEVLDPILKGLVEED